MANDTDSIGFFAAEVLQQTAARQPDKTAIIAKEEELTFAALNQRVQALAGQLIAEGIGQGDRVGVLLPNSTAIPLSLLCDPKDRRRDRDSRRALEGQRAARRAPRRRFKTAWWCTKLFIRSRRDFQIYRADSALDCRRHGRAQFRETFRRAGRCGQNLPHFKPDDDALILYTSGTTGEPKGVVLSYRNLLQYPRVMGAMKVSHASTMRGCMLPMSHIVGPVVCNELAEKGYTLVIFDQINPVTLLEGIQKYRINVFESVPIVFQLLLGVKNLASYDTSSVKIAAMMGTSIPMPLLRAFQTAQPHIKVIQGYGLTETSPMITLVEPEKAEAKMGSIGRAVPGVEVRIVDDDDKEVPVDEAGRNHHPRPPCHERLFPPARCYGTTHPRRLALHRRCRQGRSRRLLLSSRPA